MPTLLHAEHDEKTAALFQEVFRKKAGDWRLVQVRDGLAAMRHVIEEACPHALVVNLGIPKLNGLEFIEWIEVNNRLQPKSIVLYCSSADEAERKKSKALMKCHLLKDVSKQSMEILLQEALKPGSKRRASV